MAMRCSTCGGLVGYLRRSDAARFLGMSYDTLERKHDKGEGPECHRVDGVWLYPVAGLHAYATGRQLATDAGVPVCDEAAVPEPAGATR